MNQKIINPISLSLLVILLMVGAVLIKSGKLSKEDVGGSYFENDISRFCVKDLCLNKINEAWFVEQGDQLIPAESENVEITVGRFGEINLSEIVSENKEKFSLLGIGDDSQIYLTINEKTLELGNIENSYSGTYVREKDGGQVYKVPLVLDKNNLSDPSYWIQKNITNLPIYQINKVTVSGDKINKEFVPDEGEKWANETWIERLSHLKSVGFLKKEEGETVFDLEYKIQTGGEENRLFVRRVGLGRRRYQYQASRDKQYIFEISKEDFDLLTAI